MAYYVVAFVLDTNYMMNKYTVTSNGMQNFKKMVHKYWNFHEFQEIPFKTELEPWK